MVTCLYRGIAASTLGSQLESLGISTDFCPGVLVARQLENGLRFGLGSTLAFRRTDLERIGGFHSIVDYLADDYELGRRIAGLGLQVLLSDVVVETHLPAYALHGFFAHQLRWARGVRDSRAGGYIGTSFDLRLDVGATRRDREPSRTLVVGVPGCDGSVAFGNGPCSRQVRTRRPPVAATVVASANSGSDRSRRLGREFRGSHSDLARRPIRTEEGAVDPQCTLVPVSEGKTS